jgi:hypothetical protein
VHLRTSLDSVEENKIRSIYLNFIILHRLKPRCVTCCDTITLLVSNANIHEYADMSGNIVLRRINYAKESSLLVKRVCNGSFLLK